MKRTILLLLVLVAVSAAQQQAAQPGQRTRGPVQQTATYSDVYCAGFITNEQFPRSQSVAGGWHSPHTTRFAEREHIYLVGGGYQEGQRYTILREIMDANRLETYRRQRAVVAGVGSPYAELGRVQVVSVRENTAIAWVEFSCEPMVPGDIAVPFTEKQVPQYRVSPVFDRFALPSGKLTGWIVLAKDFDTIVGTGQKVYLNVGANQGVQVGDYFRVVRDYVDAANDPVDTLSFKTAIFEDTQKNPVPFPQSRLGELPRRSLGELFVLGVTPTSATAMITFALEDIRVGDGVEIMEPPPMPVEPVAEMNPPTITCFASPARVQMGGSATISCEAASPDNRPLSLDYKVSAGSIAPQNGTATLDTGGAPAGPISVTVTVTDDRNLSAAAQTSVTVEAAPEAPEPSKLNEIAFRANSAYVDNRAKAVLDDIALRLQREPDASVIVVGFAAEGERGPDRLSTMRANNTVRYLTVEKGIDPNRIQVRTGTDGTRKAEIWLVPAGAMMPPQ